jgi:hypothetical protein
MNGQDVARVYDQMVARADASPIPVPGADHPVTGEDIRLATPSYLEFKEPSAFGPSRWVLLGAAIRDTLAGDASAFAIPRFQSPTEPAFGSLAVACQDYALEVRTFADMQRRIQLGRYLAPHLQGGSQSWLINLPRTGHFGCAEFAVRLVRMTEPRVLPVVSRCLGVSSTHLMCMSTHHLEGLEQLISIAASLRGVHAAL